MKSIYFSKMKIGIELNGVLRNTLPRIAEIYNRSFIESKNEDDDFVYSIVEPLTPNLSECFAFRNPEELYQFLYEDYVLQIFGNCAPVEANSFIFLNEIYLDYRDKFDFIILSDEISRSKPATLFFLSKGALLLERIIFYSNTTISVLDEIDILLTSNPGLLLNYPKKTIKFEREYNLNIPSEVTIKSIKELPEAIKKIQNGEINEHKLLH